MIFCSLERSPNHHTKLYSVPKPIYTVSYYVRHVVLVWVSVDKVNDISYLTFYLGGLGFPELESGDKTSGI